MLRLLRRWNIVTSSASPLDRAKVRSSKRRVLTSATKSPGCGSSDQTSRLRSLRSRLNDFGTPSSNTSRPRRKARLSSATGSSIAFVTRCSNSKGLSRTNAVVNGVSSASVPANNFSWPFSSFGPGWNTIVPSPSSTIAVTPSGVSATNTSPAGSRSSKSTDLRTRFFAAYCFSGCSERRCSPSIDARRSSVRMRHGWRPMSSPRGRRMSRRHVAMRPRGPVSMKTSTTSRYPSPGSAPCSAVRSRSLTTTRVMPWGTIASKNSSAWSLSAVGESRSIHRPRSIVEIEVSTAWRNAWMVRSSSSSAREGTCPANAGSRERHEDRALQALQIGS